MSDRDLNTIPVRELISEMREEVKGLAPEEILRSLVLYALVNRIEQEADRADAAKKLLDALATRHEWNPLGGECICEHHLEWRALDG